MENVALQIIFVRFIQNLMASIRKISIYPPKHPIVVESMNAASQSLQEILGSQKTLSLGVSPDNKVMVDGKELTDKSAATVLDLMLYLKKLNIENMAISSGITGAELQDFIKIISLESEQVKKAPDINKVLSERNIRAIKVEQFSYIKIKKDEESLVVGQEASLLEQLKAKIKDLSSGKIEKQEDLKSLEKGLIELLIGEFREKGKVSVPAKNLLRKYIESFRETHDALGTLKDALLAYGCGPEEVDELLRKVQEEMAKGPRESRQAVKETAESAKRENEALKTQLSRLKQEIEEKERLLDELKAQNKKVTDEKERVDNIIRHMGEGLVVVDPQGNILLMNPQAEALLGGSRQDIGKPIKALVKDEHMFTVVKDMAVEKEGVVQKDIELFSKNESTKKIVRTSSAVVEDHNGKTLGMVTVLNDVTKQRELDRLKSNFVANVSHELRTPLVAIDKSVSLMLDKSAGALSGPQEQFLNIASRNLKRLSLLINDLLDLSKLEAGKMRFERTRCPLGKIINDSAESLAMWASTRAIRLQKQVQEGLPDVDVDPDRIIQVLNNLIGNAIKFTPVNGTVTVGAALQKEGGCIRVSVSDTGIGIGKDDLAKIFDKFYQVGERVSNDVGGTGIGLSIAREIVELHRGKIWVESEKEKGTTFIFTLPLPEEKDEKRDQGSFSG